MNTFFVPRSTARHLSRLTLAAVISLGLPLSLWAAADDAAHPAPEAYAKVTLEIKADNGTAKDPQFFATQLQIIRKNEILYEVIDRLDLVKKLSPGGVAKPKNEIARALSTAVSVQTQANTSLIEIGVTNPDSQLAADIANTIASVYRERRIRDLTTRIDQQLAEMKDELRKMEQRVRQHYEEAASIRQAEQILDPDPESLNSVVSSGAPQAVAELDQQLVEQQLRVERLQSRITILQELRPQELLDATAFLHPEDPITTRTATSLSDILAEEARMLTTVTEKDPRVVSLRTQAEVCRKTLSDRAQSLLNGRKLELKMEAEVLARLEHRCAKTRNFATSGGENATQKYLKAKTSYLHDKALMQTIEQRYAGCRFPDALSVEPVKIWERAEPSGK